MPDDPKPAPRRAIPPLMDRLGELCVAGRDSATYLWQVPNDEGVRQKIAELLAQIKVEAAKQGRQEMSRLVLELETASRSIAKPAAGRAATGRVRTPDAAVGRGQKRTLLG